MIKDKDIFNLISISKPNIEGVEIFYDNQKIGYMDLYGYIFIKDEKIINEVSLHYKIRKYVKNYYHQIADKKLYELIKLNDNNYDINAQLFETKQIKSYKFFNLKNEANTIAEISYSRNVNLYDKKIPLNQLLKIYRKSISIDENLINDDFINKLNQLNLNQLNMIYIALAFKLDKSIINKFVELDIEDDYMILIIKAIEYHFSLDNINYLYELILKNIKPELIYGLILTILNNNSLEILKDYFNCYFKKELNYYQLEEILLGFINNLKIEDIKFYDDKNNTYKIMRRKRIELQLKKVEDIEFNKLDQLIINHSIYPKDKDNLKTKKSFLSFLKTNKINKKIEFNYFQYSLLQHFDITDKGSNIYYDNQKIGKININQEFILDTERFIFSDDFIKQIKKIVNFIIKEKINEFNNFKNQIKDDLILNQIYKEDEIEFYIDDLKNNTKTLIGKIDSNNLLKFYFKDIKIEYKKKIIEQWLFSKRKNGDFILDNFKFSNDQKEFLIDIIEKGIEFKYLIYFLNSKLDIEDYKIIYQKIKLNSDKQINDLYENIIKDKTKNKLFNLENSLKDLFDSEYNFYKKYYLEYDELNRVKKNYHFDLKELFYLLKQELTINDYLKIKTIIKNFLNDKE